MEEYHAKMHDLGNRVSTMVAIGLGMKDPSFFAKCCNEAMHALQLVHYSAEVRR